ncbi:MAG: EamA family transporter RarD [Desulfomonilia bacterium]|jgi:chloramphenicol-sensitive protein RarD|nr:EamA family transporter RarD [Deltaproteobacteria bacterium]MDX9762657.1 EamA family transporter RarD [Desulfomonilia bacterium]
MKRGVLYAITAYVLWGLLPVYWKWLQHIPAFEVLCHRIVWSFFMLGLAIALTGRWKRLRRDLFSARVLCVYVAAGILIAANWLTYIWAVGAGFILETSLGYFINPLLSVLMGVVVLHERLRSVQWAAMALAAAGVCYLWITHGSMPWIALILAISFSLYGLTKKIAPLGSLQGLTVETAVLLLPALAFLAYSGQAGRDASLHTGFVTSILLVGTGLITMVPMLLFSSAARRVDLSLLGIMQYIAPSMQFILGLFVYHEPFTRERLIGFVIVWSALAVYAAEGYVSRRSRAVPIMSNRV